jgi:hypothetical protein
MIVVLSVSLGCPKAGTAGDPTRVFPVRDALDVWVLTNDREVGPKLSDTIIKWEPRKPRALALGWMGKV